MGTRSISEIIKDIDDRLVDPGPDVLKISGQSLQLHKGDGSFESIDILPKTGGTLTGDITIVKDNPTLRLNDNSDNGIDVTIGAENEDLVIRELEDSNKEWFRIKDDDAAYIFTEKIATENVVDNKIANVLDTAPDTLNTLNELAAALGDDANFSTTVSGNIAKKVDKTSISDAIDSTSSTNVASSKAVKTAYDLAGAATKYYKQASVPDDATLGDTWQDTEEDGVLAIFTEVNGEEVWMEL
jgi:hypothetical protein